MEDAGSHLDEISMDPSFGAWGIYDGHSGSHVSKFLSEHLLNRMEQTLLKSKRQKTLTHAFFSQLF